MLPEMIMSNFNTGAVYYFKLNRYAIMMPEVKFYTPDPSIQWIVKQFETIKYDSTDQVFTDKFIPRPDAALVFHFRDIPQLVAPHALPLKPYFIAPVVSVPNQLQLDGKIDCFIVICKATVLSGVFKLNMLPNPNTIVALRDEIFAPLWEMLNNTESDLERINLFSGFIDSYALKNYIPDTIDSIYNNIVENLSDFLLQDIIKNSPQSLSSLQRNFNKRVGVSMKKLMRISRINYIFKNMLAGKNFDAPKLMFDNNYYDQSHFIKDFKELTGEAPKQFFKNNTELCRILSGMRSEDFL
jgi:AraC-like DNA-binding protein